MMTRRRAHQVPAGDTAPIPAGLVGAVAALRESLQRLGSTLVVRCGSLQQVLPAVVQQFNAGEVVTEEETEYR